MHISLKNLCRRNAFVLLLVILVYCSVLLAVEPTTLKAVFLDKFTYFITWPTTSNVHKLDEPFVIYVYNNEAIANKIGQIYKKKRILDKKVEIRNGDNLDLISESSILFLPSNSDKTLDTILESVKERPILTVGDGENFAERGCMINFVLEDNHVRFEINPDSFKQSGLEVSHLLLNTAKIVRSTK